MAKKDTKRKNLYINKLACSLFEMEARDRGLSESVLIQLILEERYSQKEGAK